MNTVPTPRRTNLVIAATVVVAVTMAGCIDVQAQPSPELANQARALAQTCRSDFTRLCSGVRPGGGRGLACLQQHLSELGPECRNAIPKAEALRSKAGNEASPR